MPSYRNANKRSLEELVQAEDPNDDDYDDHASGPSKARTTKSRRSGPPARKKQRRGYEGSEIDSDDEQVSSNEESFDEEGSEDEEIETNERGRPVRKTAKKTVTYEISDESEDELSKSPSIEPLTPPPAKPSKKLIITLKTGNTPRATRTSRRGSYGAKQPSSSSAQAPELHRRRSSRLSHDPEDPLVALTDSGHHAKVVRAGSRDPDDLPPRATRGGKSIKYPSKSTIDEESQSMAKEEEAEIAGEGELEIEASQHELLESDPRAAEEEADPAPPKLISDLFEHAEAESDGDGDFAAEQAPATQEEAPAEDEAEDGDDDDVVAPRGRLTRGAAKRQAESPAFEPEQSPKRLRGRGLRSGANQAASRSRRRKAQDESSDFDPEGEQAAQEDMSSTSDVSEASPRKQDEYDSSNNGRRSTRLRSKAVSRQRSEASDPDELAAEVEELKRDEKKKRREREEVVFEPRQRRGVKKPNYDLLRNLAPIEDEEEPAPSPSQRPRRTGGGGWQRSLFNTYGPFGGGGGAAPVLGGGPSRAQGDVDSDSSDDEVMKRPKAVGGTVGMTPTTAGAFNLFPQTHNADPAQAAGGTPANLGKLKDKQALADADPLGVDQNVNFDSVGGLQGHIDQLKEMVALPLLYPEIFMRFKITPPRGVLFHGPPGTGKTLLARALATSVSSQGRKVTFYMRKGADALSKWVGEAERQLRLLFEEARKNQPSIIFFDEIDGLAPVRSSKQEQIHASIVSTLLALMDGMDGRGQVIVIGATNRPDSIDPALRRPGRFDREFYFPLPNTDARKAIIDIHTKGWDPPLPEPIKKELAEMTKGYGGADLRALCTEAALNAVQRRYPQIYSSTEKLLIDPKTIEVTPKDFMISVKKMTPSSERSASSGASPLPASVASLLRNQLDAVQKILADALPQKKRLTALEEAQYEDAADGQSFGREKMQQAFETSRVFRPRLLIRGKVGMGQQYLAAALLNHFEGIHVQAFDLPTLLSDNTSSAESTLTRLFSEVKMHKPSVIYIPNVQQWWDRVGETVHALFLGMLRSIKPTDPVLLLGFTEGNPDEIDEDMRRVLFGYSLKNQFELKAPDRNERYEFFRGLKDYIRTAPDEFPDPTNRKKRELERLQVAPPEVETRPPSMTKEELKAQKKKDRLTLNMLKLRLQPIMDQIRTKYKKFRTGVIDEGQIRYLYDEADPQTVTSDLQAEVLAHASYRPFEIGKDAHGVLGLVDQGNNNFYYNLDSVTVEKRLSNGYYKRPKDFLADIKRLAKDAKTIGDEDRLLKANELVANVEVDIAAIEMGEPALNAECERVYERELAREKEVLEKAKAANEQSKDMPPPQVMSNVPHGNASGPSTTTDSTGPVLLGEPMQRRRDFVQRLAPTTGDGVESASVVTNGIHPSHEDLAQSDLTNGAPSNGYQEDVEGDTPMGGVESLPTSNDKANDTQKTHTTASFGNRESAQPRPLHSWTAPSQHLLKESGMSAPRSQTGPFTPMPQGSHPADLQNDASTTETPTEKKTSSGDMDQNNQQDSGPNLFLLEERRSAGGSQIPSTQGNMPASQDLVDPLSGTSTGAGHARPSSSQGQGQETSSQPPVPAFDAADREGRRLSRSNGPADMQELLNPSNSPMIAPTANSQHTRPNLVQVEERSLDSFHAEVTDKTSKLSIEQLEQVNSVLMDELWQTRGEWDRGKVLEGLTRAFNWVLDDMTKAGQEMASSGSWGKTQ
ncbi:TAT-binding protein-like protein 7, AAA ATPase [Exophiala xenobiotica]|nr:TAT-binding protein-like protein 7, AAA ATPase [Exophiala xenobiotica]